MDDIVNDPRFSHILKDPKFKKLPKKHVKVKIDKRFQSMFNDKKFQIKYKVDKRGRPVKIGGYEDLKQYYELSESENEEEGENLFESQTEKDLDKNVERKISKNEKVVDSKKKGEAETQKSNDLLIKDSKSISSAVKKKLKDLTVDYARGEGTMFSDSSSEEDSSDSEDSSQIEYIHQWGELDKDAERTDTSTNRLAVCNMDWDRIQATDLMVLFNSFLAPGSVIHSIDIYPSEFGLQRMKEEDEKGPIELQENIPEEEESELSDIQMEKLRKYQLNRLKYYYAVVTCDSIETADALYKECDGLEYESSSTKLDLRFIPDDLTFDQKPRESCTSLPDFSTYKPRLFTTSALTKAKVDLTWDEADPNREEIVKSIHSGKVDENHLRKYLACSSSEDENEVEDSQEEVEEKFKEQSDLEKYKTLLMDIEENEKKKKKNDINMEVSWNLELENKTTSIVKDVVSEKNKTPFQQYLQKKKEKKKRKQKERKSLLAQKMEKSDESAFSDDDIPSDVDLNDPYFKEEIDAMKIKKPSKKNKKKEEQQTEDIKSKQEKAELELLMLDNEEDNRHFNVKKIEENEKQKKKKLTKGQKRRAEELKDFKDDFKIDVNDERFSALYTSHHFNIDPADPQFKSTKATRQLIEEKLRRREKEETGVLPEQKKLCSEENIKNSRKNAELSLLVKSIKKNTEIINKKSRYG